MSNGQKNAPNHQSFNDTHPVKKKVLNWLIQNCTICVLALFHAVLISSFFSHLIFDEHNKCKLIDIMWYFPKLRSVPWPSNFGFFCCNSYATFCILCITCRITDATCSNLKRIFIDGTAYANTSTNNFEISFCLHRHTHMPAEIINNDISILWKKNQNKSKLHHHEQPEKK